MCDSSSVQSTALRSLFVLFCFFFSSRRRHTRYWRDWSSDVCSSDLGAEAGGSLNTAMQGLLAGLYVAFDTTAIALCFSIALMFVQFMLDRGESQLLSAVDRCASEELGGRFELRSEERRVGNGL